MEPKFNLLDKDTFSQTHATLLAICGLDAAAAQILNLFRFPTKDMEIQGEVNKFRISFRDLQKKLHYVFSMKKIRSATKNLEDLGFLYPEKSKNTETMYFLNVSKIQTAINSIGGIQECWKILAERDGTDRSEAAKQVKSDRILFGKIAISREPRDTP